ncbi:phage protein [Clostridium tetani E88]|uniref:Phage protein n=1 Tax=Clostridium tetani (strain Massachusetts / E88) TaxID=212717 RepID=Q894J7_CLOTE|nr:phage protein [Clostridium tetani E88]
MTSCFMFSISSLIIPLSFSIGNTASIALPRPLFLSPTPIPLGNTVGLVNIPPSCIHLTPSLGTVISFKLNLPSKVNTGSLGLGILISGNLRFLKKPNILSKAVLTASFATVIGLVIFSLMLFHIVPTLVAREVNILPVVSFIPFHTPNTFSLTPLTTLLITVLIPFHILVTTPLIALNTVLVTFLITFHVVVIIALTPLTTPVITPFMAFHTVVTTPFIALNTVVVTSLILSHTVVITFLIPVTIVVINPLIKFHTVTIIFLILFQEESWRSTCSLMILVIQPNILENIPLIQLKAPLIPLLIPFHMAEIIPLMILSGTCIIAINMVMADSIKNLIPNRNPLKIFMINSPIGAKKLAILSIKLLNHSEIAVPILVHH